MGQRPRVDCWGSSLGVTSRAPQPWPWVPHLGQFLSVLLDPGRWGFQELHCPAAGLGARSFWAVLGIQRGHSSPEPYSHRPSVQR